MSSSDGWCATCTTGAPTCSSLVALLHLLRVFFTGAFHGPRQFNWVIGLSLLLVVLASNFTGYLLPWDQLSYWAVTICTGMLGYVPWLGEWLPGGRPRRRRSGPPPCSPSTRSTRR